MRMAEPGEFTRRAFLAGRIDLTQAEGVAALIHANGERALAAARRLLAGELGRVGLAELAQLGEAGGEVVEHGVLGRSAYPRVLN